MEFAAQDLLFAVVAVFAVMWVHRDGLRAAAAAVAGALLALGVGALIGVLWTEQRPFVADHFAPLVAHTADASFPSDHLLALGGVAGGMWPAARRCALATTALAVAVAFGRVFVGIHYVQDVAAGFAIGVACGLVAWLALAPALPLLAWLDDGIRPLRLRPVLWGGPPPPAAPPSPG